MRTKLLLVLIAFGCVSGWGQKTINKAIGNAPEIAIKKQIIVYDLERQLKEIPLASIRIFVMYKTADWLWQNKIDETGQAEQIAVKALDELYERQTEIPSLYFNSLSSDIFALLEINAQETAKKLSAKYNLSSEDNLNNAYSLLDKKDGEKLAADKIRKSLADQTELDSTIIWLMGELKNRKSPEFIRILAEILSVEETGRSDFSADTLFQLVDLFRSPTVSNELRTRFYKIVLKKARNAVQFPDSDADSAYSLLYSVRNDIARNAPNLLAEASILQASLTTRIPNSTRASEEVYKRIEESPDRLDAIISEAESVENKALKETLLTEASLLALKKGKFILAVDLLDKLKTNIDEEKDKRFFLWYDQFLGDVSQKALAKDDTDSANYAAKRIINKLKLAEVLRKTALYYFDKRDLVSATNAFDRALKITTDADNDVRKIYSLIALIYAAQKIDKNRVSDVTEKTAKAIDAFPTLNIDDKPETENYKKYVTSIMSINFNLLPVFKDLVKTNKNEAIYFNNRISRKEIKIVTNYVLLTDALENEIEANKKSRL